MIGRTNAGGGVSRAIPAFTFTGVSQLIQESGGWKIKFLTSGTLTLLRKVTLDVFCVGGGGGGYTGSNSAGGGGGGGYTNTGYGIDAEAGTYEITIGNGAVHDSGEQGGTTSAFNVLALGGYTATSSGTGANGGSGGGAAGSTGTNNVGGSDGSDGGDFVGSSTTRKGGAGQNATTREFGETTGDLYAGGGGGSSSQGSVSGGDGGGGNGGGSASASATNGEANTGGGGGGYYRSSGSETAGDGGSGIVIIRNAR